MGERGRGGCCPPMDLMPSEPMHLVQIIIPTESAHRTISYLGDLGLIQFKDLNAEKSPFQRTYANQVKLGELEAELVEINANGEKLQRSYNELAEYKLVIQKAGEFFQSAMSSAEAHQREYASNQSGEESLKTPLLSERETTTDHPSKLS